ncbi:MAG TPA: hypothetical protein VHX52_01485 [Steroidobacteraceae bacterium]|jgi:hypothetical protein|nr:hypothetical protein [Steroidobacteraceae bacterium]
MHDSCLRTLGCALAVGALSCLGMSAASAAGSGSHPDLSGVWGPYIEPGRAFGFGPGPALPFTVQGKAKVDAYRALVAPTNDNPGAHCLGYGMPLSMVFSGGYPMEIIQRPEQITIIYEAYGEIRRLYLGDKILPLADRPPDRDGYSAAHWQGDTLVVETTTLREQEDSSYPHSDQARITERYHLEKGTNGARILVADWTLTDPAFYTRPVVSQKKWTFDPKGILLPYECDEEGWLDHLQSLRDKRPGKHKAYAQ